MAFNLVDEPWVLVQHDRGPRELSLSEIVAQADRVRSVSGEVPTQGFAILRVLLAICHDAIGWHTEDDMEMLRDKGIDLDRVSEYLAQFRDRFHLFDEHRPFMQVADLHTAKGEHSGLEKIIADVPNGHPFFTTRAGKGIKRISPAEAARWLVHVQAFDPSGIRSGAVGDKLVKGGKGYPIGTAWAGQLGGIVVHGRTLVETLANNIAATPENPTDRPVWALHERHTAERAEEAHPSGPVQLLVWQSRRVRLIGDESGVHGVVLAQGDRAVPQNLREVEPMSAWRYSKPQSKKFGRAVYMPNKHEPSRALWRGLPSIIAFEPGRVKDQGGEHDAFARPQTLGWLAAHDDTVVLQAVGIAYGGQEATIEEIVDDRVELHADLLTEDGVGVQRAITDAVAAADACVRQVGQLAANLARAAGEKGDAAGDGPRGRAMEEAWAALDQPARRWVGALTLDTDVQAAKLAWQSTVDRIVRDSADQLVNAAGPAAIRGRTTSFGFVSAALAHSWFLHRIRDQLSLHYSTNREVVPT